MWLSQSSQSTSPELYLTFAARRVARVLYRGKRARASLRPLLLESLVVVFNLLSEFVGARISLLWRCKVLNVSSLVFSSPRRLLLLGRLPLFVLIKIILRGVALPNLLLFLLESLLRRLLVSSKIALFLLGWPHGLWLLLLLLVKLILVTSFHGLKIPIPEVLARVELILLIIVRLLGGPLDFLLLLWRRHLPRIPWILILRIVTEV